MADENLNINDLVASFKEYIASFPNAQMPVIRSSGYKTEIVCKWNDALSEEVISEFFSSRNWEIPNDYRDFMRLHNGATLFTHSYYGGGLRVLSIQEIDTIWNGTDKFPAHCLPIIWQDEYNAGSIFLDSQRYQENKMPYLYYLDAIEPIESAIPINTSFTVWFDRLIMCQGAEYWLWEFYNSITNKNSS